MNTATEYTTDVFLGRRVTFLPNSLRPDEFESITLAEALRRIADNEFERQIQYVISGESDGEQQRRKKSLPAFALSGTFNARVLNDTLNSHSGVVVLDYDDVGDPWAFIKYRCDDNPHVIAAFPSTRGEGVKVLVPLDCQPANDDEHKIAFYQVCEYFEVTPQEDKQSDVRRLTFVSAPGKVHVNRDAVPFHVDLNTGHRKAGRKLKSHEGAYDSNGRIKRGCQYNTLLETMGDMAFRGVPVDVMLSTARHIFDNHMQNPDSWEQAERMVRDIAAKDPSKHETAGALVKSFLRENPEAAAGNARMNKTALDAHGKDEEKPLPEPFVPNWDNEPPATKAAVKLNGKRICSAGNLSMLIAQHGIGKSSVMEAICAAAINPECDAFGFDLSLPDERPHVLYFDTERSIEDHWHSWRRTMRRAEILPPDLPGNVAFHGAVTIMSPDNRRAVLENEIRSKRYGLVLIDGAADFVADVNDTPSSNAFCDWLRGSANELQMAFIVTIHANPSPDNANPKARGHLGSELMRRAEAVFVLVKDRQTGQRTLTTNIPHGKVRNDSDDVESYFTWDDEAAMFTSCENQVSRRRDVSTAKLEKLAAELFEDEGQFSYTELVYRIEQTTGKSNPTAKRRVKDLEDADIIVKTPQGFYIPNRNDEHAPF